MWRVDVAWLVAAILASTFWCAGVALADCTTAICTPSACPAGFSGTCCTITGPHQLLDQGCALDFGANTVTVSATGILRPAIAGWSYSLHAANFILQGLLQAPGNNSSTPPTLQITVDGTFRMEALSAIDVAAANPALFPGSLGINAGGAVTLLGDVSADGGTTCVGGRIAISGGSISITSSSVHADGASSGCAGGSIAILATGGAALIDGSLSVKGGVPFDGSPDAASRSTITVNAIGLIRVTDSLNAGGTQNNNGGTIRLVTTGGDVDVAGEVDADSSGAYGQAGEITIDAAHGVSVSQQLHANGTNGGNGGFVSLFAKGGDVNVLAPMNATAKGDQGWGGNIDINASGGITLNAQSPLQANGAKDGIGGAVRLLAGGNVAIGSNVSATASAGGYIEVTGGPTSTITIQQTLDARATGGNGGTIVLGPACNVMLPGSLRTDGGQGGTNIIKYRNSFDVRQGTMRAGSVPLPLASAPLLPVGNLIDCGCQDADANGVCDPGASCQNFFSTVTSIVPAAQPRPRLLGPCGCGNFHVDPGEQCDSGTCVGGLSPGVPCTDDANCPGGGQCRQGDGGLVCVGGSTAGTACTTDSQCASSVCVGSGSRAGIACATTAECVVSANDGDLCSAGTCDGGPSNGLPCNFSSLDCQGWPCSIATCQPLNGATCDPNCTFSQCGNGFRAPGEACDDGNTVDGDGCSKTCTAETGWRCDDLCAQTLSLWFPLQCTPEPSACTPICGNGLPQTGEGCDDGNLFDGDGCSSSCSVEFGWSCSGEPSVCTSTCGDGITNRATGEQCDPPVAGRCDAQCQLIPYCGDGNVDPGEQCDDGPNNAPTNWCNSKCFFNICGDGQPSTAPPPNLTLDPNDYGVSTVPFRWIDISSSSTFVPLGDDEISGAIPIGFDFSFFGHVFSQLYISSNGFIAFDPPSSNGCCEGLSLPTPGWPGDNLVAGFWTDLYPPLGIGYSYAGVDDVFVIEADNIPLYSVFFGSMATVSLQYQLYRNSNRIEVHYLNAQPDDQVVTAGIENGDGSRGYEYYSSADGSDLVQTAVAYVPPPTSIGLQQCDDGTDCSTGRCNGDNRPCTNACTPNLNGDGHRNCGNDGCCGGADVCGEADDVEQCDNGGRCVGGTNAGAPCTVTSLLAGSDFQCPGGACVAGDGQLACVGGAKDGAECTSNAECAREACLGGPKNGTQCNPRAKECPGGTCSHGTCLPVKGASCDSNGVMPGCGNGYPDAGEQCDDGTDCSTGRCNGDNRPCKSDCTMNWCGDGLPNYGADGLPNTLDDIEQCDLGDQNGQRDSICTSACTYYTPPRCDKRLAEWYIKNPVSGAEPAVGTITCEDGAAWCDGDAAVDGKCEFAVDLCALVQSRSPGVCNPQSIQSVELPGLDTRKCWAAAAANSLAAAVGSLMPAATQTLGICTNRGGASRACTFGDDRSCDTEQPGDGICAPQVVFDKRLVLPAVGNQAAVCPPGATSSTTVPIIVPAGQRLRVRSTVYGSIETPAGQPGGLPVDKMTRDRDLLNLVCRPAPVAAAPIWTVGPCASSPTPTPTAAASPTPSDTPTATAAATATQTSTMSPTTTSTATPVSTVTPTTTSTPTPSATSTQTATVTSTPTVTLTATSTRRPTNTHHP